jgi:hypothetical protein
VKAFSEMAFSLLSEVIRRLNQLKQRATASNRKVSVAFGVNETNVMACGTSTDAAWRKAHALLTKPVVRGL